MRSPAFIAIARVFSVMLGFITTIVVARTLGPTGRGETSAAIAALYIAPLVLGTGLPLTVRRHAALGQADEAVRTARRYALLLVPLSALAAFLLLAGPLSSLPDSARIGFVVGILAAPLGVLWLVDQSVLVARQDYVGVAIVLLGPPVAFATGVGMSAAVGAESVGSVILCNVAGTVATWVFSTLRVRTSLRGGAIPLRIMVGESLTYAGAQIAEAFGTRLAQLILLPLMGATQLGLFAIGDTLAATPLALAYALNARFYTAIAVAPGSEVTAVQARAVRAGLLWSALATVCLLAAAPIVVPLAFGPEFDGAVLPAMISALGTVGLVTSQTIASAMAAVRRGRAMTVCQVTGLAITVTLMLVSAPVGGALTAAASSAFGATVTMLLLLIVSRVPLQEYVPSRAKVADALRSLVVG